MFKIKYITIFLVSLALAGTLQAMAYTQEERDAYSQYMKAQKAAGQKPISMQEFIRQLQAAPIKEEVEGLKNKLAEKDAQLEEQRKSFEQMLDDLRKQIKTQESKLFQLEKERDKRGTDLASAGEKLAQAQKQNEERINAEKISLQKQLVDQQKSFDQQIQAKNSQIETTRKELADLQNARTGTAEDLRKERARFERERQQAEEALRKERETLAQEQQKAKTDLQQQAQMHTQEFGKLQAAKDVLQKQFDDQQKDFEKQIQAQQTELAAAQKELNNIKTTQTGTSEDLKKEHDRFEKEKQQLDAKKAELEAKLDQQKKAEVKRLAQITDQIQNKNSQIKNLEKEIVRLRTENKNLQSQLRESETTFKQFGDMAQNTTAGIKKLTEQFNKKEDAYIQKLREATDALQYLQQQLEQKNKQIEDLTKNQQAKQEKKKDYADFFRTLDERLEKPSQIDPANTLYFGHQLNTASSDNLFGISDEQQKNVFHHIIKYNNFECLNFLIDKAKEKSIKLGTYLDQTDNLGNTALHDLLYKLNQVGPDSEIGKNCIKLINKLLDNGASAFVSNKEGKRPIDLVKDFNLEKKLPNFPTD
jgi:chromosome segregation ATPase